MAKTAPPTSSPAAALTAVCCCRLASSRAIVCGAATTAGNTTRPASVSTSRQNRKVLRTKSGSRATRSRSISGSSGCTSVSRRFRSCRGGPNSNRTADSCHRAAKVELLPRSREHRRRRPSVLGAQDRHLPGRRYGRGNAEMTAELVDFGLTPSPADSPAGTSGGWRC